MAAPRCAIARLARLHAFDPLVEQDTCQPGVFFVFPRQVQCARTLAPIPPWLFLRPSFPATCPRSQAVPKSTTPVPKPDTLLEVNVASEAAALEIWHNPRCSKSRRTLALIEDAGRAVVGRPPEKVLELL